MLWDVPRLWDGSVVYIIGGGPSFPEQFNVPEEIIKGVKTGGLPLSSFSEYLTFLQDKHVIGINNAYQIGNWIDINFFGDCDWYLVHKKALARFPGVKVSCCPREGTLGKEGIKFVAKNPDRLFGITTKRGRVSWNKNSGAAAISLACQLGVKRIVLLGFDMQLCEGVSHWFGSHVLTGRKTTKTIKGINVVPKRRAVKPNFKRHLEGFPAIAEDAKKLGVDILNMSSNSAIDCFRKITMKEVLSDC